MIINIRDKNVDIQTTDGVWFNMTSDQLREISDALEIIQVLQENKDIGNVTIKIDGAKPYLFGQEAQI